MCPHHETYVEGDTRGRKWGSVRDERRRQADTLPSPGKIAVMISQGERTLHDRDLDVQAQAYLPVCRASTSKGEPFRTCLSSELCSSAESGIGDLSWPSPRRSMVRGGLSAGGLSSSRDSGALCTTWSEDRTLRLPRLPDSLCVLFLKQSDELDLSARRVGLLSVVSSPILCCLGRLFLLSTSPAAPRGSCAGW